MGCQELVYTLVSTTQDRKHSLGRGTYACFIDFKLAYPSTDHSVIFTKLHEKGIQGPIWRNIASLYANMKSHVLHPHIREDDYFDIKVGVREGSVLSPMLFLVAIDDMREYLARHPFYSPRSRAAGNGNSSHNRAPGVWVGQTYLGLLQYVDDAVLLANSPEELQHMIDVIAKYCQENRWTLNPKTGKTEVVEFLTPPSGFTYSISAPTSDNIKNRACIGVVQGYPYLGWWLDNALTLDYHTTQMAQKIAAASARVGRMGGRPGGLPVRTAFHLWASLALPYIHGASALLSDKQIEILQKKVHRAVHSIIGKRADPAAVLCDLGLPDAKIIRDIRLASLFVRLQTLPEYLAPAALHRFLHVKATPDVKSIEGRMMLLLGRLGCGHLWQGINPQALTLAPGPTAARAQDRDPIGHRRSGLDKGIKLAAWNHHRRLLLEQEGDDSSLASYVGMFKQDLLRPRLDRCASYLLSDITPSQQACLLLFRTGGSLLAHHTPDTYANFEDNRCHGCRTRHPSSQDVCENIPHALLVCVKEPYASLRTAFMRDMEETCASFRPRDDKGTIVKWSTLEPDLQSTIALGGMIPRDWQLAFYRPDRMQAGRDALRAELTAIAAPFLQAIARGLRTYKKAVLRSLAARDKDFVAVWELWGDLGQSFEEPSAGMTDRGQETGDEE